jgi:hypothetical protein
MKLDHLPPSGFLLDTSPVEFVLVGPRGNSRGVIVRSSHAQLDLIASLHESPNRFDGRDSFRVFPVPFRGFPFPFPAFALPVRKQLDLQICRISTHHIPNIGQQDDRLSDYELVWRGIARKVDLERVEKKLSLRATDLYHAIKEEDIAEIEWQMAPVIQQCHHATEYFRRQYVMIRSIMLAYVGIMLLVILGVFLRDYFSWLRTEG